MEEGLELHDQPERVDSDRLHKKVIRAGKRTYFFDVKSTREKDFYIVITESKKCTSADGEPFYEKHKIFIYQEDFDYFLKAFSEMVAAQKGNRNHKVSYVFRKSDRAKAYENLDHNEEPHDEFEEAVAQEYSNIEFEDLGNKS